MTSQRTYRSAASAGRTTTSNSCCAPGFRRSSLRPHHTGASAAALAASPTTDRVQGLRTRPPVTCWSDPAYLADDCCLLSYAGRRPLRSDSNELRNLLVPRTHSKLGDRSFSVAGPRLWNDLPARLRRPGLSFDTFKQSLKTYLFGDRSA